MDKPKRQRIEDLLKELKSERIPEYEVIFQIYGSVTSDDDVRLKSLKRHLNENKIPFEEDESEAFDIRFKNKMTYILNKHDRVYFDKSERYFIVDEVYYNIVNPKEIYCRLRFNH